MTKVISWLIVLLMLINPCFSNVVKAEQEERFQQYEDDEFYIALEKGYGNYVSLAVNFINDGVVKYYNGDLEISNILEVRDLIQNNTVNWQGEISLQRNDVSLRSGGMEERVKDILRYGDNYSPGYGTEYFNKFIYDNTIDQLYVRIYQDMNFEAYYDYSKYFKAGTELAIIAATFAMPEFALKSIVSSIVGVRGVYETLSSLSVEQYVANVNYWKEAKIYGKIYYDAGQTIYGKVTFGDIGAQYDRGRTSTGGDFNDNRKMAENAVYRYRGY